MEDQEAPWAAWKRKSGEKAKNFKGAMKRLFIYMERYRIQLFIMLLFAVGSTIFNIIGPKILGRATTELFNGLVSKISGGAGIDFGKIARFSSEPCACTQSAPCSPLSKALSCRESPIM